MPELQVRRGVFDQYLSLQMGLHLIDVAADDSQRLLGHRQGQQVRKISPADDAPREMLGYEPGRDPLDHLAYAIKMNAVEPFAAAKRETGAMQRDRVVRADGFEVAQRHPAVHVIFGVYFEPRDRRPRVNDGLMVLKPQPDPRLRGNRAVFAGRIIQAWTHGYAGLDLPP